MDEVEQKRGRPTAFSVNPNIKNPEDVKPYMWEGRYFFTSLPRLRNSDLRIGDVVLVNFPFYEIPKEKEYHIVLDMANFRTGKVYYGT